MPLHVIADYLKGMTKAEKLQKFEQEVSKVASLDFSTGENFCLAPNTYNPFLDIDRIMLLDKKQKSNFNLFSAVLSA